MTRDISEKLLSQLSRMVASRLGLHFPAERWRDLERNILTVARENGFESGEACAQWLLSLPPDARQIDTLARFLTVGETYFYREQAALEILSGRLLPDLIAARRRGDRRLRVWSAGCCTGEEPYSIAILLDSLIPDLSDWQITLLATDINPHFLQKASVGLYGEWSFRGTPAWMRQKYFSRASGGRLRIDPRIQSMVTLAQLNLAEEMFPSPSNNTHSMDLILCRNVLMYFSSEKANRVVERFGHSLVEGGWFIVSPSETSHIGSTQFATVNFPGAVFFRKGAEASEERANKKLASEGFSKEKFVIENVPRTLLSDVELVPQIEPPAFSYEPADHVSPVTVREETRPARSNASAYELALALYERGEYTEAVQMLESQGQSHTAKTLELLARAYANQGKLDDALRCCEKAIAANKLDPALHYLAATILAERGRIDEAVGSLRRAIYIEPNFVLAHFLLGNLMLKQGLRGESRKHFENSIGLLPAYGKDELIPESDGLTAGRLSEVIASIIQAEAAL